jgi:hypothetical protein
VWSFVAALHTQQQAEILSVSEKLARYGSSALSGVEHLTLLVRKKSIALALVRHFGSRFLSGTTAIPSAASG